MLDQLAIHISFRLDEFDGEFKARMTNDEWQRIAKFRNTTNFDRALPKYNALMLDFYSGNIMLNKVVTEVWRFEMLVYALHLYDTRDPLNPRSGLTLSNLEKICAVQKCASAGRVRTIVGIMWLGGFLKRQKSNHDNRVLYFEPSQGFIDIVEGWNRRIFQTIDCVFPDERLADCHIQHPRFGWEMRKGGALGLIAGWKLLDPFPEVNHFVASDGGWMLLLHCAHEALKASNGTYISPVNVELAIFGKRFGVSRSHLRRLLESAYDKGFLSAPPKNGTYIVFSPKLLASYLTCFASELEFFRGHALAAKQHLDITLV